jgi:hypothetical protein
MAPARHSKLDYPKLMATVGHYIAKKKLSDVCVMEFEHGILIVGTALFEAHEDTGRRTETHVLSIEELERLAKGV